MNHPSPPPQMRQSPVFSYLAKACALLGDEATSRKALAISEHILAQPASAPKKTIADPKARSQLLEEGALSLLACEHVCPWLAPTCGGSTACIGASTFLLIRGTHSSPLIACA